MASLLKYVHISDLIMNELLKIGLLKEEICKMITEREHDLSNDINPDSLPQLRKEFAYAKTILASAKNSKEFMVELLKEKFDSRDSVSEDSYRETIEKWKMEYADKLIDEGHLKGQVKDLTRELNSLRNEAARIREEIRDVKGEYPGSGDGNPWQVGVAYGGRRPLRSREGGAPIPPGQDWGQRDRGERRDQDRSSRGRERGGSGGYGYGRQSMW